jgi:hypothetical protein
MQFIELNEDNFLLYAAKNYNSSGCLGLKEFYDDLKRFKYIKRLLKRYEKTGIVSERLLLNHFLLLHNVFGSAVVPMLFFKFEESFWPQIKTFLVFLNYMPETHKIQQHINESDIPLDQHIIFKLRKI